MKRAICAALLLCLLLSATPASAEAKYTTVFFELFDTVTTLTGYAQSQQAFDQIAADTKAELTRLHRIFDPYNAYEGVNNVCTLNQQAALAPVRVDDELFAVLAMMQAWQPKLQDSVNVAMGSVLLLWHDARQRAEADPAHAAAPDDAALQAAAQHMDMGDVVLDAKAQTVYFSDPFIKLDLGAVAKGYAAGRVADWLRSYMPSYLLSIGGNVCAGEPPRDGRAGWTVSVQDPAHAEDAEAWQYSLALLRARDLCVVTSGDYQRYYDVNGVRMHHIISQQTLYPARENRSVTILCADSAMADMLSTALFILPYEQGRALLDTIGGADAIWLTVSGELLFTDGAKALLLD